MPVSFKFRYLDISKACGYDNISNSVLKLCADGIYKPLTHLINLSFSTGQYPTGWKLANVIPLFKKDDRQSKSNYRPISLLPSITKICEKVAFMDLYKLLDNTEFFYRFQQKHGISSISFALMTKVQLKTSSK